MNYQKLELHINQVQRTIKKCRCIFKSTKKQEIYDNLINLFNNIKKSNYQSFQSSELLLTKTALDIIFCGVQHLDYKKEYEIPKRLIYCLNLVLNDWIKDGTDNYFIVISYNNNLYEFKITAFDEGYLERLNKLFKIYFSVEYKQSLIQISKPKFLFNDYLGSIPVYHELGHFIDKNYQIIESLFRDPGFLPHIINSERTKIKNHYSEFFADIFASQYIGRSSIEPLNYISFGTISQDNNTHPSNEKRIKVVNAFLQGTGDKSLLDIISHINNATIQRTNGLEIKKRSVDLTLNPFQLLKPVLLESPTQIHTLFSQAWANWLDETSKIRMNSKNPFICFNKINKLIIETIDLSLPVFKPN